MNQMNESDYWTIREIGRLFGVTSHVIGRKLKELGLRTEEGRPSRAAFQGGYCRERWTRDYEHYCWAWHADKTVRLLKESGLGRPAGGEKAQARRCERPKGTPAG